ncbi:ATP-binding cassette domain-containing protein [Terasakiella sp. SH-1]|uniref:ABC transporter ATP-binding protein n=1 Tax=Terasakiella sp. SH-1 TaxID=2560057 RepID=UPI001431AEAB|nr:ATP-binding cassette domain-containing protein [Terasakiella sp. SH-1]
MKISIAHKAYDGQTILKDIELDLHPGEIQVICGPSGAGKSTLLRIVAGLDEDFDGHVTPKAEKVGFVFQEPRLLPWRTVRDNVALVCPNEDSQVDGLLEEVGLGAVKDRMASKLSLGMARRVSLARALAVKPDVLILDEPFVSLDPDRAEALRRLVFETVQKYQLKALFVTHIPSEAIQLGSRIQVLKGPVLEVPLTREERFNTTFVLQFLQENETVFAFS